MKARAPWLDRPAPRRPRRPRPTTMWKKVLVVCSCGAEWHGWHAIGNPLVRDHYNRGHWISDRRTSFAVADREEADAT